MYIYVHIIFFGGKSSVLDIDSYFYHFFHIWLNWPCFCCC